MSRNKVLDKGDMLQVTAPYAVASGDGMIIGASLFGVAEHAAAISTTVTIDTAGVFTLPKSTAGGTALVAGNRVFWDNTARVIRGDSAVGRFPIGIATAAAADGAAFGVVKLANAPFVAV